MRPQPEMIPVLIEAAKALKGAQKRLFLAKTVKAMGRGGQLWAQEHLGWCRDTIRKGMSRLDIELAYYPPYHSKYNPIERCWGILELHWNGALLDSVEAVLGYAETMSWKGGHPEVVLVEAEYSKGVKLGREEMEALESAITRLPTLEKWFVSIPGRPKKRRAS